MMARKLMYPPGLALLVVTAACMCALCAVPLFSAAAEPTSTTQPASPALPNAENVTVPAAAGVPAGSSAVPEAEASPATASKKFPVTPPDVVEPAAEVGSALPVPVPETLPNAASLGFGGGGHGDQTVPGGGLGGYNGGFGGCCGGFGYNGFGYNNGPLFFNSAPAGSLRSMAAANVWTPLLVACILAMFCA